MSEDVCEQVKPVQNISGEVGGGLVGGIVRPAYKDCKKFVFDISFEELNRAQLRGKRKGKRGRRGKIRTGSNVEGLLKRKKREGGEEAGGGPALYDGEPVLWWLPKAGPNIAHSMRRRGEGGASQPGRPLLQPPPGCVRAHCPRQQASFLFAWTLEGKRPMRSHAAHRVQSISRTSPWEACGYPSRVRKALPCGFCSCASVHG